MSPVGQMETRGEIVANLQAAIFFENEKHIGFDPITNEPIFWGSRPRAKIGPKIDPATGEQEWRKHAQTGVPLVKVNEMKGLYQEEHIYKKIDDGHGNVYREECEHPDVLWARFHEAQQIAVAEDRGRQLLRELGASGLTAEEIMRVAKRPVQGSAAPEPGPSPQPKPSEDGYPFEYAPSLWYLSAEHQSAVEAGDVGGFEGTEEEAMDAVMAAGGGPSY